MTKDELAKFDQRIDELSALVNRLYTEVELLSQPKHGEKTILGENVFIDKTTVLVSGENATIRIGDNSSIWRGGEWTGPVTVGKRVFVNQGSYLRPLVTLEDDVSLGPFVRLITDTHEIGYKSRRTGTPRKDAIRIGQGCWIGAGATVMGGVTIGRKSIVAVGAVVNKNVPDNVLVAGVPARVIREIHDRDDFAELVRVSKEN